MFFHSVFWQHILNLELKPFHWRLSEKREWKIKCWFQTYWSLCLNLLWRINSAKVISFVTYLRFGWNERIEIIILSHLFLQGQQFPFSDCLLRQFFFLWKSDICIKCRYSLGLYWDLSSHLMDDTLTFAVLCEKFSTFGTSSIIYKTISCWVALCH